MREESHKNILVIRGGAVGDFLLTMPVLAGLRERFPGCRLVVLGYPAVASLAVAAGLADEVVSIESARFGAFFVEGQALPEETAAWFAGFDEVVSFLYDPEGVFQRNVRRYFKGRFVVGIYRADETKGIHAAEQMGAEGRKPCLRFPEVARARRLAIHPGSGSERKNWGEANWAGLLKLLVTESSIDFLLVGGEAEGERCARLAAGLPAARVQVAQNLPLVELARMMQGCSAFIGHDSGITHLAAALGLPGLVLWGDTSLATWRPLGDGLKILPGLKMLPVETVWRELKKYL